MSVAIGRFLSLAVLAVGALILPASHAWAQG
jgi:hypothetical protein